MFCLVETVRKFTNLFTNLWKNEIKLSLYLHKTSRLGRTPNSVILMGICQERNGAQHAQPKFHRDFLNDIPARVLQILASRAAFLVLKGP